MMALLRTGLAALALAATAAGVQAEDGNPASRPPVVIELYTSQSCSSCPPADRYLGELAKAKGVIALSLHVTYWNYLGWKDDLSSAAATNRQKAYRWSLRQSMIWTPQIVVHGRYPTVGSRRSKVAYYMKHVRKDAHPHVTVALTREGARGLRVAVGEAPPRTPKVGEVYLFLFDKQHTRKIRAGENAGRTITYHNVVREIRRLGAYTGEAKVYTASADGHGGARRDGAVVVVQERRVGPIYGVALLKLR
jgi:hypothetical protein